MQVLIFGGTRFLGRTLVERMLARGDHVTLLTRGRHSDPFGASVRRVLADRRDAVQLATVARGAGAFDAIVDFTAYRADDVRAALAAFGARCGRWLHVSSTAVLEPPGDPYADGKRDAEAELARASQRWTVLRPPVVQGAYDHTLRSWRYQLQIERGAVIPLPPQTGRFTHVWSGDVASALLGLLDAGQVVEQRCYTIAQQEGVDLAEYLAAMAAALRLPLRTEPVGYDQIVADPARLAWHPYLLAPGHDRVHASDDAQRDFGFRPTPMRLWLPATSAWFAGPENRFAPPEDGAYRLGS